MDRKRRRFHCRQEERRHPDKTEIENFQLHIEWCVPENITGTSQGRGNSGIFLQDMYEIQVLDCYNNEIRERTDRQRLQTNASSGKCHAQAGWMECLRYYLFRSYLQGRRYLSCSTARYSHPERHQACRITRLSWVQRNISVSRKSGTRAGPIRLQSHGDPSEPISFRNIWIRKCKFPGERWKVKLKVEKKYKSNFQLSPFKLFSRVSD